MTIPSLDAEWINGVRCKPRIYVLEIRARLTPEQPPVAWLYVERTETYRRDPRDNQIFEASIRLSFERILPTGARRGQNSAYFSGSYSRGWSGATPCVSLTSESTSKGAVFLDLPGLEGNRIGTYLLNEIVTWVRQWPDAEVRPIELVSGQAGPENKERRNRFYEQFGLVFDYADEGTKAEGLSRVMPAANLTPVTTWADNIRELDVRKYVGDLLQLSEHQEREARRLEGALEYSAGALRAAEMRPLRWAMRRHGQMLRYRLPVLALWAAVAGIVWAAWFR